MRAVAVSEFGATPALMNLPEPEPGPGEVLVKMVAAGLNPVDWKIADGMLKDAVDHAFPLVMGTDGAGVVEAVGPGPADEGAAFRPGDQVYGQFFMAPRGLGSFAEYAIVTPGAAVARMPEGMIYSQAAAVPTATTTAFNMVEKTGLDEGQTVLVVGATGGVGQSTVQLAADRGAKVIATARPGMADEMRRLGADEIVDHGLGDLNEQVLRAHADGIDVIIDMVSDQAGVDRLAALLRPGGTYISPLWSVNPDKMEAQQLRGLNFNNEATPELLTEIAELIDAGRLRVMVHDEASLADAPAAIMRSRAGGSHGKTVIRL
ncbi:NADP-dependent oxidoreductase [Spirillospora sp. NPDC047279]|uniref:NADP-dependent oxidoreductase n=1 Tax=Spirillospora sp. NPDC047279 TaxID=3155478 RepID=UPI0033D610E8